MEFLQIIYYNTYVSISWRSHKEIVKILVAREGFDIPAKDCINFTFFKFQNNIWCFFNLLGTAIKLASENCRTEVVKILVEAKKQHSKCNHCEGK